MDIYCLTQMYTQKHTKTVLSNPQKHMCTDVQLHRDRYTQTLTQFIEISIRMHTLHAHNTKAQLTIQMDRKSWIEESAKNGFMIV